MDAAIVNAIVGANIRKQRKRLGKSQKELGEQLGVSYQQVQKYECGQNGLTYSKLIKVAGILGCSIDDLCTGVNRPEEEWELAPLDFHVLLRLGLATRKTPPPAVVLVNGKPESVLMSKALYQGIMRLLAELPFEAP